MQADDENRNGPDQRATMRDDVINEFVFPRHRAAEGGLRRVAGNHLIPDFPD